MGKSLEVLEPHALLIMGTSLYEGWAHDQHGMVSKIEGKHIVSGQSLPHVALVLGWTMDLALKIGLPFQILLWPPPATL